MLCGLEDLAPVGALALEDTGCIVETVREDMELGLFPRYDPSIVPDPSVTLIERGRGHR
jgi:hypothetical protein